LPRCPQTAAHDWPILDPRAAAVRAGKPIRRTVHHHIAAHVFCQRTDRAVRADVHIDWDIPPTPPGWRGELQRLLGPGKSSAEYAVELVGGGVCVALLACLAWRTGAYHDWSPLQAALITLVALDLVGGVLTNSTNAAKRWYHRPAPGTARARLVFVSTHVMHLAAVALVMLDDAWPWLLVNASLLLACAVLIELVPLYVKRPAAMAAYLAALLVNLAWFALPAALAWLVPLFFLKLLVCHLVPEAPLAARAA
jgi:hypothetical protein